MEATARAREHMQTCYEGVRRLIHQQIHRTVGNGAVYDVDQAQSDANLAFCEAWHTFNPEKGRFTTHVGFRVHVRLLNEMRRNCRRRRHVLFSELTEDVSGGFHKHEVDPSLPPWVERLSNDGKALVKLALKQPKDVEWFIAERGSDGISTVRSCLREFLLQLGWDAERVRNAFQEVKDAAA